jgi:hypothetical protein
MKSPLCMLSMPVVVALLAACTTIPVGVESDPPAVFARYHTFACMPGASYGTSGASVVQDAREAIEGELVRKGFNRAEDAKTADFVVGFTLGAQDRRKYIPIRPHMGGVGGISTIGGRIQPRLMYSMYANTAKEHWSSIYLMRTPMPGSGTGGQRRN